MLLLHIFGKLEDNMNSFHKIAGMEDARERGWKPRRLVKEKGSQT